MANVEVSAEVHFAQKLASNEKKIRDRALKRLHKYLSVRSTHGGLTDDDFLKIWKGLFYCMWMQDKPVIQEELSKRITNLLHSFPKLKDALRFVKIFLDTQAREWNGIDKLRLDKFMMMVRDMLHETFSILSSSDWPFQECRIFSYQLLKAVMQPEASRLPDGLRIHLADIFIEELQKVSLKMMTSKKMVFLLKPFIDFVIHSNNMRMVDRVFNSVIQAAIDTMSTAKRKKHRSRVEKSKKGKGQKAEPAPGDDGEGQCEKSEEDDCDDVDEKMEVDEEQTTSEPPFKFDIALLLLVMFRLAERKTVRAANRAMVYNVLKSHPDVFAEITNITQGPGVEPVAVDLEANVDLSGDVDPLLAHDAGDQRPKEKAPQGLEEKRKKKRRKKKKKTEDLDTVDAASVEREVSPASRSEKALTSCLDEKEIMTMKNSADPAISQRDEMELTNDGPCSDSTGDVSVNLGTFLVPPFADGDATAVSDLANKQKPKKRKRKRSNSEEEYSGTSKKRSKVSAASELETGVPITFADSSTDESPNDKKNRALQKKKKKNGLDDNIQSCSSAADNKESTADIMVEVSEDKNTNAKFRQGSPQHCSLLKSSIELVKYPKNTSSTPKFKAVVVDSRIPVTSVTKGKKSTLVPAEIAGGFSGDDDGGAASVSSTKEQNLSTPSKKQSPVKTQGDDDKVSQKTIAKSPVETSLNSDTGHEVGNSVFGSSLVGELYAAVSTPCNLMKKAVAMVTPNTDPGPVMEKHKSDLAPLSGSKKKVVFNLRKNKSNKFQDYLKSLSSQNSPFQPTKSPSQSILKSPAISPHDSDADLVSSKSDLSLAKSGKKKNNARRASVPTSRNSPGKIGKKGSDAAGRQQSLSPARSPSKHKSRAKK